MKLNKENIVLLSMLAFFVVLYTVICLVVYKAADIPQIDILVRDFAYSIRGEKGGLVYWIFRILTEFGDLFVIIVMVIAAAIYTKLDNRFFLLLFVILFSRILNTSFKAFFDRERPIEALRWQVETSSSFPSGHSTNVAAIFGFVGFVMLKSDEKCLVKRISLIFCPAIILIVMFSRNILGVHYFTDVTAGMSLGMLSATIGMILLNVFNEKNILTKGLFEYFKKSN